MTDKRFFLDRNEIVTWIRDKETWEKLKTDQQVIDKLNALHEENHELECEREKLMYANEDLLEQKRSWEECSDNYAKLYQENEQLKHENQRVFDLIDKHLEYWTSKYDLASVDTLQKLKKELEE